MGLSNFGPGPERMVILLGLQVDEGDGATGKFWWKRGNLFKEITGF